MQYRAGQIIQDKRVESAKGKKDLRLKKKNLSARMGFSDPTHYSEHCWSQNPQVSYSQRSRCDVLSTALSI